jgi:RimJ/RimL family protein N-acetyltransferase
LKQYKKNKAVDTFAIERDGKLIGAIGLSGIIKNHKAELGYWLGKEYRGRGIITEAVGLVTKYAFDKLKLKRVSANVFSWNEASKKVLKKNSYKFEGVLKKYYEKGGKSIDVHLFAKIK